MLDEVSVFKGEQKQHDPWLGFENGSREKMIILLRSYVPRSF